MYDEFEKRNTVVIAVAQEDKDVSSHAKMVKKFEPEPRFEIGVDIGHEATKPYDHTTVYLIDKQGKVREIFPTLTHSRPNWKAVLHRIDDITE
jgi:alkyl hydroperoxide reductase subunit AhpC